jgi:hypothetical protein
MRLTHAGIFVFFQEPSESFEGPSTFSEFVFENLLPDLLVKKKAKAVILVIFAIYLGLSIYWVILTRLERFVSLFSNQRNVSAEFNNLIFKYF